eukprot:scaffold198026_cov19-Tisochrysis_lutea.AAC.4
MGQDYSVLVALAERVLTEALDQSAHVCRWLHPLQVVAVKAPGFGERKTSYMEDIAILTGGQLVKDELGISLEKAGEEVLGMAAKVRAWAC